MAFSLSLSSFMNLLFLVISCLLVFSIGENEAYANV